MVVVFPPPPSAAPLSASTLLPPLRFPASSTTHNLGVSPPCRVQFRRGSFHRAREPVPGLGNHLGAPAWNSRYLRETIWTGLSLSSPSPLPPLKNKMASRSRGASGARLISSSDSSSSGHATRRDDDGDAAVREFRGCAAIAQSCAAPDAEDPVYAQCEVISRR